MRHTPIETYTHTCMSQCLNRRSLHDILVLVACLGLWQELRREAFSEGETRVAEDTCVICQDSYEEGQVSHLSPRLLSSFAFASRPRRVCRRRTKVACRCIHVPSPSRRPLLPLTRNPCTCSPSLPPSLPPFSPFSLLSAPPPPPPVLNPFLSPPPSCADRRWYSYRVRTTSMRRVSSRGCAKSTPVPLVDTN
jgi:hypothetical protein